MKKLLALILVFTMCLSIVACNNTDKPSDQGNQNEKPNDDNKTPSGEPDAEQYYNTYSRIYS